MAKATKGLSSRFTLASGERKHRTIASLNGEVATGKTYFGCTARGPVLSQNIDIGTEGVIEQFIENGKEIYDEKYVWNPGDIQESDLQNAAIEIRNKWETDYRYAINNGIGTIIWDTESRIWQVYRYAEFGAPNADSIKDYDALNQRFEANINLAKEYDINLFIVRSMKNKWGQFGAVSSKTGKKAMGVGGREVWGYEHLPGMMMMELMFIHDPDDPEGTGSPYQIRVEKCRHNVHMQFTTIARCSFPELGTLLLADSTEENWS